MSQTRQRAAFDYLLQQFAASAGQSAAQRWRYLEAAHVLGQNRLALHLRAHWQMLRFAQELGDRQELTGQPFGLFDYTPVGLGIALVGFVFLSLGWRLLPTGRRGTPSLEAAFNIENYTAEARLPAGSPLAGKTVAALEARRLSIRRSCGPPTPAP